MSDGSHDGWVPSTNTVMWEYAIRRLESGTVDDVSEALDDFNRWLGAFEAKAWGEGYRASGEGREQ